MKYKVLQRQDISFGTTKRLLLRVRLSRRADGGELRRIAEEIIAAETRRLPVNAIGLLFYLPGTGPGGAYTAGSVDWAPEGLWEKADEVKSGNYSRHGYTVEVRRKEGK